MKYLYYHGGECYVKENGFLFDESEGEVTELGKIGNISVGICRVSEVQGMLVSKDCTTMAYTAYIFFKIKVVLAEFGDSGLLGLLEPIFWGEE